MAERALAEGPEQDETQFEIGKALGEYAGAAVRAGIAPDSPEALAVVQRLEAMTPGEPEDRAAAAARIEAFTDRRVARYWALVGIIDGWPPPQTLGGDDLIEAWEWYAKAERRVIALGPGVHSQVSVISAQWDR
jgi:hypothetical protein